MAALGKTDLQPAGHQPLLHIPASAATRTNAHHVYRAVADVMVTVAAKVLRRELPIAGNEPLLDSAQHLSAPLTAIPGIQREVQVTSEIPKVFQKRRGRRIPGGPDGPFVAAQLGDLH